MTTVIPWVEAQGSQNKLFEKMRDLESRLWQTGNVNLYDVTKFFHNLFFNVHHFYPTITSFALFLSIKTVLDCFQLHVFYFKKFSN